MTPGDEIDQRIISILRSGGKRKQKEIIALCDSSATTIRNHLEYLTENHNVCRKEEGNNVFYTLENQGDEVIQPLPHANTAKVNKLLRNIYQGDLESVEKFGEIASSNYYVLSNTENIRLFFDIFDTIINGMSDSNTRQEMLMPRLLAGLYIQSTGDIYSNWEKGKEDDSFNRLLNERADKILSAVDDAPVDLQYPLQALLSRISYEYARKAYIKRVIDGKSDQESLVTDAYYQYDANNEIDELLSDLEDAREAVDPDNTDRIDELIEMAKDLYRREKHFAGYE